MWKKLSHGAPTRPGQRFTRQREGYSSSRFRMSLMSTKVFFPSFHR